MSATIVTTCNALEDGAPHESLTGQPVRAIIASAIVLLLAIGGLLFARRLAGAFTAELGTLTLLATALTTTALVATARLVWRRWPPGEGAVGGLLEWAEELLVGWGASATLLLIAAGTSFQNDQVRDCLIWLPLLALDQFWRQDFLDGSQKAVADEPASLSSDRANDLPENVVQQVYRVREADGSEAVYATLLAEFVPGQRHQVVHLGFCPPLDYQPEVEADPCAGPPASLKVVQAFAHGARIDVRLAALASEAVTVAIDLVAQRKQNG